MNVLVNRLCYIWALAINGSINVAHGKQRGIDQFRRTGFLSHGTIELYTFYHTSAACGLRIAHTQVLFVLSALARLRPRVPESLDAGSGILAVVENSTRWERVVSKKCKAQLRRPGNFPQIKRGYLSTYWWGFWSSLTPPGRPHVSRTFAFGHGKDEWMKRLKPFGPAAVYRAKRIAERLCPRAAI